MEENSSSTHNSSDVVSFSIANHLEWNKKKQDMIINLGLANTNPSGTGQTPTPTRFIRNCEKVGLFQDLQNVNPFDEEFKKAIQNPEIQKETPPSDDSLHTPQICPQEDDLTRPEDNKTYNSAITLGAFYMRKKNRKSNPSDLNRLREANKASQTRFRKRRQKEIEDMKEENKQLKNENARLLTVNRILDNRIRELETELQRWCTNENRIQIPNISIIQPEFHKAIFVPLSSQQTDSFKRIIPKTEKCD
ncbi:hypothetical protein ABEB36_006510 [Hypothenemus hampei]|uniref:BZIP domain-containing protein n=1 Tax=Hypothenemus hampei TaxID=57062 RepID=A0ABD1ER92_HYPHA